MLKLKINLKLPQLLCIVVSAAQNGEFERFGGFCVGQQLTGRRFIDLAVMSCENTLYGYCNLN